MIQKEPSAVVDYGVGHKSVVERGQKSPKLDKLIVIANVLVVERDGLL